MPTGEQIKCIFCLQLKSPSVEHVIPRTLGGNLTIRCVCKECNESLSQLDQSLADASLLVLPRVAQQPDAVWGKSAQLVPEGGELPLEIKIGHRFQSEMKAQLIFKPKDVPGSFTIRGSAESVDGYKEFFKVLRRQISKAGLKSIPTLASVDNADSEGGFRLVLNRSNQVVFRPSSESADSAKEFEEMVDLLTSKLDTIEKEVLDVSVSTEIKRVDQPNVILNMAVDFGRNLRAVSKIAFTFLAFTYGCEFVLDSRFAPLRRYILTGDNADDPGSLWWNGENKEKSLGSSRYAAWMKDHKDQIFAFGRPEAHAISIHQQVDRHVVTLEFYGQLAYVVDVGDLGMPLQLPLVHEFDYTNRTNEAIPPLEILRRFRIKLQQRTGEDQ